MSFPPSFFQMHRGQRGRDSRSVVDFSEARLVNVQADGDKSIGAAYVELAKPEFADADFNCAFCSKRTMHEHDFTGKIKFDPKSQKYFISLVKKTSDSAPKKRPSLQIIPVPEKRTKALSKPIETSPKAKAKKIYPLLTMTEEEMVKVVKAELAAFSNTDANSSGKLVAVTIREKQELVLMKIDLAPSNAKVEAPFDCGLCKDDSRELATLGDVVRHFRGDRHKLRIRVKRTEHEEPESTSEGVEENVSTSTACCSLCGQDFNTDDALTAHLNEIHAGKGEIAYQCVICLRRFKNRKCFLAHKRNQHRAGAKLRQHECYLCAKTFLKAQHLQAHVEHGHLGARPFKCDGCDKSYTTAYALNTHRVNTHGSDGERPKCNICDKTFSTKSLLNRHMLTEHERDSRLVCEACEAVYLSRETLEAHLRTCGLKRETFSCRECEKTYRNEDALTAHMRSAHGILP